MTRDLAGARILVTRPENRADALCTAIESAGGEAVRYPVMRIVGSPAASVADQLAELAAPDLLIFVSASAVEHGLARVAESNARIAAIGPATASALAAAGRPADLVPATGFDSESLLAETALTDVDGQQILIVRGEDGRELLGDSLLTRGADVSYLSVYQREAVQPSPDATSALLDLWRGDGIDAVTVMSVKSLRFLLAALPDEAVDWLGRTPLVGPGDRVIQTASELVPGIPAIAATGPRAEDIVNALLDWRRSDGRS